jgi:D-alanyl-D-alanine-carboxypeptidase/D-alanyl-D-alanine-endopeptidase
LGALRVTLVCALAASVTATAPDTARADALLDEAVEFTGQVLYLEHKVPALIIGAVRNGEVSVHGFGQRSDTDNRPPDGNTMLRVGSITKAFTGQVLAHLAAKGTVSLTQRVSKTAPDLTPAKPIRLIDLVTHSAGLPRELPRKAGPNSNPYVSITRPAFATWLKKEPLLYTPGRGVLYSNIGFDLLAIAMSEAAKKPYPQLLRDLVTKPLGLKDTTFKLKPSQKARMLQGHNFDGKALPDVPTGDVIVGSGGLHSTANDLLRWMRWHLDRNATKDAEVRLLDHSIYLVRDGLNPVYGMDESGHMDAIGLAWVVMMPKGNRPLILQKAGGRQGIFTYIAFAPARGVAVFVAINEFSFGAATAMAKVANELIATLAPR